MLKEKQKRRLDDLLIKTLFLKKPKGSTIDVVKNIYFRVDREIEVVNNFKCKVYFVNMSPLNGKKHLSPTTFRLILTKLASFFFADQHLPKATKFAYIYPWSATFINVYPCSSLNFPL